MKEKILTDPELPAFIYSSLVLVLTLVLFLQPEALSTRGHAPSSRLCGPIARVAARSAPPAGMLQGRRLLRESLAAGRSNYLLACGTGVLFSYGSGAGRPRLVSESCTY